MCPLLPGPCLPCSHRHQLLTQWEHNRQEGQGSPDRGNRLQVSDIFYLSFKQQEETNYKCQIFFPPSLYKSERLVFKIHNSTWFHQNFTFLKPWANQCIFLFFLSYVNETMYLLRNLPFFKMVPPKTNFIFLFSNLGLIIAQQTNIHINCFMAGGWHTSCHPISKMHIVGGGLSALRGLSYLISCFLTDRKQLAKISRGHSPSPFCCLC